MTPPTAQTFSPRSRTSTLCMVSQTRQTGSTPDRNAPKTFRCHEPRPQPASRCTRSRDRVQHRAGIRSWLAPRSLIWALLCGLLFCCRGVRGESVYGAIDLGAELVFDRSTPPPARVRMGLDKRQEDGGSSSSKTSITAPTGSSSTATALATASVAPSTDLPRPFDSSLGNNFTAQSCPDFFNSFLSNSTFQSCLPFSLLLQTSSSFFTALRSPVLLTRTLTATCTVPYQTCSSLLSTLSTRLKTSCASDLQLQNPLVTQALAGFKAYDPLYHAACLTAPETGNYCFADAATNASAPSSSYVYYVPLGMELPSGVGGRLACTRCLRDTMAIFASAADEGGKEGGGGEYAQAAQVVEGVCGSGFLGESVLVREGGGSRVAGMGWAVTLGVVLWAMVVG